jgi:hypothetical protein
VAGVASVAGVAGAAGVAGDGGEARRLPGSISLCLSLSLQAGGEAVCARMCASVQRARGSAGLQQPWDWSFSFHCTLAHAAAPHACGETWSRPVRRADPTGFLLGWRGYFGMEWNRCFISYRSSSS